MRVAKTIDPALPEAVPKPEVVKVPMDPTITLTSEELAKMLQAEIAEIDRERLAALAEKARLANLD
jgi:hypothetical protein